MKARTSLSKLFFSIFETISRLKNINHATKMKKEDFACNKF